VPRERLVESGQAAGQAQAREQHGYEQIIWNLCAAIAQLAVSGDTEAASRAVAQARRLLEDLKRPRIQQSA